MYKVIFHVDELAKWQLTLENARNFLAAEQDAAVEILANSEAVKFFPADAEKSELFVELMSKKVRFAACMNALKKSGLTPADLPDGVEVVPAGVVELAKQQQAGFAYIRP
jgi:hypothetical protein